MKQIDDMDRRRHSENHQPTYNIINYSKKRNAHMNAIKTKNCGYIEPSKSSKRKIVICQIFRFFLTKV